MNLDAGIHVHADWYRIIFSLGAAEPSSLFARARVEARVKNHSICYKNLANTTAQNVAMFPQVGD